MNIADIRLMYDYNNWANRLLLEKSELVTPEQFGAQTNHSFGSLHGTLLHTLDTEWSWRILLDKGEFVDEMKVEEFQTLAAVRARWEADEQAWDEYLSRLTDADMLNNVHYDLPEGGFRDRVLWHCLWHVVNHGMQHRAEAAHLLTQYGQSPGGLDFTRYMNIRNGVE
jgi:uncharacterized damage-inducible protein DinB